MDISGKDASLKIWMVPIYVSRKILIIDNTMRYNFQNIKMIVKIKFRYDW